MFSGALEVEFHRPPQVPKHTGFAFVSIGQHFLVEGLVTGLRHIRGDGVEEPQAVVRAEVFGSRGFFGAGVVVKWFDHRDGATVGYLTGEHQLKALAAGFGVGRENTQHVLHGIAEAQSVALAVIHQRRRTRPVEAHLAVIRRPHIHHRVELRVGRFHGQRFQFGMVGFFQFLKFLRGAFRRAEFSHGTLAEGGRISHAQQEEQLTGFAGGELHIGLDGPAGVVTIGVAARAGAQLHHLWILIVTVHTQEGGAVGIIRGDGRVGQRQVRMACLVVGGKIHRVTGQVVVDGDAQHVVTQLAFDDEQRILQVDKVLLGVPVIGELAVGEGRKAARFVRLVGDLHPPVFKELAERYEVGGFGGDAGIF